MNCIGIQGQSVLDFYLSLNSRSSPEDCRGPLVYLDLIEPVMERVAQAAASAGKEYLAYNLMIAPTEEDDIRCGSCAAHWIDISAVCVVIGRMMGREDIRLIGHGLINQMCDSLDWDGKELDNYLRSRASLAGEQS